MPNPIVTLPAGSTLVFNQDFTTGGALSVSDSPSGSAIWYDHTPYNGDFGDAFFGAGQGDSQYSTANQELTISCFWDTAFSTPHWQSGLLSSMYPDGHGFTQALGYWECKMWCPPLQSPDAPNTTGLWPAFWLDGANGTTNPSTDSIEIDICEAFSVDYTKYHTNWHVFNEGTQTAGGGLTISTGVDLSQGFHTFSCWVTQSTINYYFDGSEVFSIPTPPSGLLPLYVMVDLALGGGFDVNISESNVYKMLVQYIRCWSIPMGNSFFVSQSGSGSANGTSGNPWSVTTFNGKTTPVGGDTVFFLNTATISTQIKPSCSGTSGNPITFDFTGCTISGTISLSGVNWITLDGKGSWLSTAAAPPIRDYSASCIVTNTGDFVSVPSGSTCTGITVNGFQATFTTGFVFRLVAWGQANNNLGHFLNLTVSNNNVVKGGNCINGSDKACTPISIVNNFFSSGPNVTDQTDVVTAGDSSAVTITGNVISNNAPGDNPSGRHNDCVQTFSNSNGTGPNSGTPGNWVVNYNLFLDATGSGSTDNSMGMYENMGPNNQFFGNVWYCSSSIPGNGLATDSNESNCTFFIFNNTFYGPNAAPTIGLLNIDGPMTVSMQNNVVFGTGGTLTQLNSVTTGTGGIDFNFLKGSGNVTGTNPAGTHGSEAFTPVFNSNTTDWSLKAGSNPNLIGKANNAVSSTYGQGIVPGTFWPNPALIARPIGGAWDPGAYQTITDTTPPSSVPSLSVGSPTPTTLTLTWGAATDANYTSAQLTYLIEHEGGSISTFTQFQSPTGAGVQTLIDNNGGLGLSPGTTYTYRIRAQNPSGLISASYFPVPPATVTGTTSPPDTTPPLAPTGLTATAFSSSQINLTCNQTTDSTSAQNTLSYQFYRSTDGVTFVAAQGPVPAPASSSALVTLSDTGLMSSTLYNYRVQALDPSNNLSPFDPTSAPYPNATTLTAPIVPQFVQSANAVPQGSVTTVAVPFGVAQTAGNANIVMVGINNTTASVSTITDTLANTYVVGVAKTTGTGLSHTTYYAQNIKAGANTITVNFSSSANAPDVRTAEYSNIKKSGNPIDNAQAFGLSGNSATSSTASLVTTTANDMLVAGNVVAQQTNSAGTGWVSRVITMPDGDILQDQLASTVGTYAVTANLNSGAWVMQSIALLANTGSTVVSINGIASAESFGRIIIPFNILLNGIPTAESFGRINIPLSVSINGIASAQAFGASTISKGNVNVNISGILTQESFGNILVVAPATINIDGIATSETFGNTVVLAPAQIFINGIPTGQLFGNTIVGVSGSAIVNLSGIATGETFGSSSIAATGTTTVIINGIPTAELLGQVSVSGSGTINIILSGIPSAQSFGLIRTSRSGSPINIGRVL